MSDRNIAHKYASVAQSVEQGTENPRVGGSIPPRGTIAKDRDRAGVAQLAEQLICNQQVAGSIPVTSSNKGRFPSGQREQTVNLPTMSSVVRIHPFPPQKKDVKTTSFFCGGKGWIYEPRRFSAWFGCPPKAAAFAKLLPSRFRRRKAGSEPPPLYGRQNDVLFLWWEGVDLRTTAL